MKNSLMHLTIKLVFACLILIKFFQLPNMIS